MHSPLQARYPQLSAKFDVDPGAGRGDPAQFPGALLRHRDAVLHRAFPLALDRKNPALGRWVFLPGDLKRFQAKSIPVRVKKAPNEIPTVNRTGLACD